MKLLFARESQGFRLLLSGAAVVIVVAGLRAAAPVLLPVLVALFLTLLCLPPVRALQKRGLPGGLAVAAVVLFAGAAVLLVGLVVGQSVEGFQEALPHYRERLTEMLGHVIGWVNARGLDIRVDTFAGEVDSAWVLQFVGDTAGALLSALSGLLLVLLLLVFMLIEAQQLPARLRRVIGERPTNRATFERAIEQVHRYLAVKVWISLATGILAGLLCLALGIDFPLLWGLLAFLFNFVPNIGSIVAALPPVLLALVQHGAWWALLAAAGYLVINTVLGNVIEPRWMGRRLGMSTLVVFLSMLFWGWVWGPVGMLLSVPLTVVVKILAEHSDEFRGVAALLGPVVEATPAAQPEDAGAAPAAEGTTPLGRGPEPPAA